MRQLYVYISFFLSMWIFTGNFKMLLSCQGLFYFKRCYCYDATEKQYRFILGDMYCNTYCSVILLQVIGTAKPTYLKKGRGRGRQRRKPAILLPVTVSLCCSPEWHVISWTVAWHWCRCGCCDDISSLVLAADESMCLSTLSILPCTIDS